MHENGVLRNQLLLNRWVEVHIELSGAQKIIFEQLIDAVSLNFVFLKSLYITLNGSIYLSRSSYSVRWFIQCLIGAFLVLHEQI